MGRPKRFRAAINDAICKYGDYQFTVDQYRRRSSYALDTIIHEAYTLHTPCKMPSEPENGMDYHFGATGFDTLRGKTIMANGGLRDNHTNRHDYDAITYIPTGWKNIKNYYHWMISELPYLALAYSSAKLLGAQLIVIPDHILSADSHFAVSTLEALQAHYSLDIPVIARSDAKNISADRLHIPYNNCSYQGDLKVQNAYYSWYHSSRATAYALQCFKMLYPLLPHTTSDFSKRIYINRKTRTLKNEPAIQKSLSQQGFDSVSLETLSLREQASVFQNAEIIVGMHGAGLTNLGFCQSGTRVIEFADPAEVAPLYKEGLWIPGAKATRTHYHMISATLELDYHCLWAPDKQVDLKALNEALASQS